jgi:hypothetical protein
MKETTQGQNVLPSGERKLITRAQYMAGEATHNEYYDQFGKLLIGSVRNVIGLERIAASRCEHFNDIPLHKWDAMESIVIHTCGPLIKKANGTGDVSLSDCACAAKSAARLIREQAQG